MTAVGQSAPRSPKLGRYELITQIGQGGMAEVQLALQRGPAGFEKLVVVKLVHESLASQKAFVDMLLDEARVAALVKHPNVVDIYDLGQADGRYFIAMEYLEGEPLLAVLRAGREGQRLDVLSTARLIADTAEGLDAAHELRSMAGDPLELVHHDVSLGNIVVLYNGQVKLVDFGVAKATQSTARARVQGKFSYMAPEKLRGGLGDRRSDIWSLGCVLWEALTLTRLFKGGNDPDTMNQVLEAPILAPSAINGDVPASFDPVVMRSLERDPARRYPTAKAMAAELEEVLRKHGYAAKNDMIARYMQATFKSHIAARKKLLQEVSSKGRASPAVLEAAFHHGALAQGSPPEQTLDPSVTVSPGPAPHRPPPSVLGDADLPEDLEETVLHPRRAAPLTIAGDERTDVEAPVTPRGRRNAYVVGAAGLAALLATLIVLVGGGQRSAIGPAQVDALLAVRDLPPEPGPIARSDEAPPVAAPPRAAPTSSRTAQPPGASPGEPATAAGPPAASTAPAAASAPPE
ncbi:MAG TPA: serine/threonine-protein kinase, partial [Kofleriaceae bacterium]|nr:serine/threonine-protein kinase [Kofleriaceae bacterium]